MAVYSPKYNDNVLNSDVSLKDMTLQDLQEFSNVFASQFNNTDMHDRVLCFEIIEDESTESTRHQSHIQEVMPKFNGQTKAVTVCSLKAEISGMKIRAKNEKKETFGKDIATKGEIKVVNLSEKATNIDVPEVGHEQVEDEQDEEQGGYSTCQNKPVENQKKEVESENSEVELVENNVGENSSKTRQLFVHSQWLAVQSPYFKALFYSGIKESYSTEVIMKIYEHELKAHLTLIEAMYKLDTLNNKDYRLIVDVLVLAHKYDVRLVIKKCKYVLMSSALTLQLCEYIVQKTKHITDTADTYDVLEKFLIKEFTPIDKTWTMDKFTALSEESLRLLLKSDSLATQSKNTIFVARMKWIRMNIQLFPRYKLNKCRLLDVLRFEFMSVDFLYDIVQHHYLAQSMPGFNKYLLKGLAYHGFSQTRRLQLEPKPRQRPLLEESGPTFSWVIDEELEKKLSNSLETPFFSDIFWFQGYEMKLQLIYTEDLSKCSFYVCVLDLAKEACLHVKCTAKSELFLQPLQIDNVFTNKSSGWGYYQLQKNTAQKRKSYTIDVWVKFASLT